MASDLTVGLDMIAAATVPTKPSARLLWGVVTATAAPVQVVLENDASATSRPVSGNAAGPCVVGDRVLLARQRRRLTIISNPTAQARLLADTGWTACTLNGGFTGTARVRRVGLSVWADVSVTGTFAEGNVQFFTVPAGFRPSTGLVRLPGYADAYPAIGYVSTGGLGGVTQRSGASRTSVQMTGSWLVN